MKITILSTERVHLTRKEKTINLFVRLDNDISLSHHKDSHGLDFLIYWA